MIDRLFYAKLPPKLKRTVNMARLEDVEIVVHLEREIELNALEESDDLTKATMTSSTSKSKSFFAMGYLQTLSAITARKKDMWSKTVENLRRRKGRMPKKATNSKENLP